ncbi:HPr kinase/phosphorylase [Labeo rohita]|uniref:HPr kinase/phosphorylase n=1 Tax=Labeo rohita TaxID=84645 RepID=A0ABQ8L6W8_LABRO|nr:HPr kinase/phosphorylase [Labeo rohita]
MKYCGVVTQFKGVCVYARSAMGIPGSETALEVVDLSHTLRPPSTEPESEYYSRQSTPVHTSLQHWPLANCAVIPRPDDQLWIVTDGALRDPGLGTTIRFQVSVCHIAGAAILPSDYAIRHAAQCDSPACQVCSFVRESLVSAVCRTDIADILWGTQKVPFANRAMWESIQSECPDLCREHAHLRQGTCPSKRVINVKDVKRLDQPSANQLRLVVSRYFYTLDLDSAIQHTSKGCHQCDALVKSPVIEVKQSSCDPPETVGSTSRVFCECVTSFTAALLIDDEQKESLWDGILPVHDQELIALQHAQRLANRPHSVTAKAPLSQRAASPDICHSDLVYLYSDRNKSWA